MDQASRAVRLVDRGQFKSIRKVSRATGVSTAEQGIKPARRRGLATHIPSLPDLKLGHAEKERQTADQRVADRKPKTGYIALIPLIHFSVGIAHFTWDDDSDDQGFWNAANHQWSVDQDNRSMTSDSLQHSILFGVAKQSKRANLKKWVYPDANGERGEWSFGYTNPTKVSPRDVATWDDTRMLSTVVDSGPYEQKPVPDTTRKLVSLWLYWTPNEPERNEPPTPIPRKRQKASKAASIKTESSVKSEIKDEPLPPVTPATVIHVVAEMLAQLNEPNARLGKNWLSRFLDRHPDLETARNCGLDSKRITAAIPSQIEGWFTHIDDVVQRFNIHLRLVSSFTRVSPLALGLYRKGLD